MDSPTPISQIPTQNSTNSGNGFYLNMIIFLLIVILFFGFIGVNVFIFLAQGLNGFSEAFKPFVLWVLNLFGLTAYAIGDTINKGVDATLDVGKGAIEGGTNALKNTYTTTNSTPQLIQRQYYPNQVYQMDGTNGGKNVYFSIKYDNKDGGVVVSKEVKPDDADSNIQVGKKYCYMGMYNGTRNCAVLSKEYQESDCISGEIYDSMKTCIDGKKTTPTTPPTTTTK